MTKYKADTEKYRLQDRSISCRNAWYLKTYDINEAGQVHTYLCYLADLPISEQRYWKSFNEEPKAGISKRAFETDFQGEWSSEYDPLGAIKDAIARLDTTRPSWWTPRGEALLDAVRYPATDAAKEWADEILALDQLLVEGFIERGLKRLTEAAGGEQAPYSGGLNALIAALKATGLLEDAAIKAVAPLKTLHYLRSKVKGHAAPREAEALRHDALATHGTFRAHFTALAAECDAGLDVILRALGISNEEPLPNTEPFRKSGTMPCPLTNVTHSRRPEPTFPKNGRFGRPRGGVTCKSPTATFKRSDRRSEPVLRPS